MLPYEQDLSLTVADVNSNPECSTAQSAVHPLSLTSSRTVENGHLQNL